MSVWAAARIKVGRGGCQHPFCLLGGDGPSGGELVMRPRRADRLGVELEHGLGAARPDHHPGVAARVPDQHVGRRQRPAGGTLGHTARQVHAILGHGADTALELVGTPTLPDTLRTTRVHGVVCFTGMLSSQWTVRDFYPIDDIPRRVRLISYGGDARDLPPHVLQAFLDAAASGDAIIPIDHIYRLDEIVEAHTAMEAGTAAGKLVVTT